MRFSIRWKLILSIGLPVILIFLIIHGLNIRRLMTETVEHIKETVEWKSSYYAEKMDVSFEIVAQIARSTAGRLEQMYPASDEELFAMLEGNLQQNPLIYGSAIAFEPEFAGDGRDRFSPFVYRDGSLITGDEVIYQHIDIATESYDYRDGQWEWYSRPQALKESVWTEPYYDDGAGDVVMTTYSVPFYVEGKFAGVTTVDIMLDELRDVTELDLRDDETFFILSPSGYFLVHWEEDMEMDKTIFELAQEIERGDIAELGKQMVAGQRGVWSGQGVGNNDRFWVYYAPIGNTGWSYAEVALESNAMAFAYSELRQAVYDLIVTIVLVLGVLWLVATHLTIPLERLAVAVKKLAGGDLDVQVERVEHRDEIGDLANGFNQMTVQLKEHIEALTHETSARQAVESELNIARKIQTSLLPRIFPPFPDRMEFQLHAMNESAKQVAGDFFDFALVDKHMLYFCIADVSGKGVPAALYMAVTRTLLRNQISDMRSPADVLNKSNRLLAEDNANGMFITLFMGFYNTQTGEVLYCNAGHPPPFRQKTDGTVEPFGSAEETCPLLGVIPEAEYVDSKLQLHPGERLVCFTDGVPEAASPEGVMIREPGFAELLEKFGNQQPIETLCDQIIEHVDTYCHHQRGDDITLLILQCEQCVPKTAEIGSHI